MIRCSIDPWLQQALGGGIGAPLVLLAVFLLWWGQRAMRREHFGKMPLGKAVLFNLPAISMHALAAGCIVTVITLYLRG